jgi:hypothetical protein
MRDLWERWAAHHSAAGLDPKKICRDGIVDEAVFSIAKPRVLFVMKEVNGWEGGNLADLLGSGPRFQMWHTIGRCAAGLLDGFPPYVDGIRPMKDRPAEGSDGGGTGSRRRFYRIGRS